MINKIITLAIRLGATWLIAVIVAQIVYSNMGSSNSPYEVVGGLIGLIGLVYALFKFNDHYTFGAASKAENQIGEVIDKKKKFQTEEEMLRVKKLFDQGILTKEEYEQKMDNLKAKYL